MSVNAGWLDRALDTLVTSYILSLTKSSLAVNIAASLYAVDEMNQARKKAGRSPVEVPTSELALAGIEATQKYEKMLKTRKGTYVVVPAGKTEKLKFVPWLKTLKTDIKAQAVELMQAAEQEGWDDTRIQAEIDQFRETILNKRIGMTAFVETRTQEYQAKIRTWGNAGTEWVQRVSAEDNRVCSTCRALENRIYPVGDEAPLSHAGCRCEYIPLYYSLTGELTIDTGMEEAWE